MIKKLSFGLIGLCFFLPAANSAPIAEANGGSVKITLTDEPCRVAAVSNLQKRAIWEEDGKLHDGCWGAGQGLVMLYFESDRTVVAIAAQAFQQLNGA